MRPTSDVFRVLIGQSARMRQLHRLVEKVGPQRWPILLIGETGTGKEVVARQLHSRGGSGPFVTIDCSSMVGPLMESELFGHAKGSFTGAHQSKIGLIEMAHGGTAFLDEIGELPLDMQSKLLRVLQEKEFRPVGSLAAKQSDFRLIAATNRDLAKEVEKGTFRRDLYYRLNVVTVRLTPLRERKDDIPILLQHFLSRYGRGHSVAPEVLDALLAYDWPGNVRELENCVQHMVAVNSGPAIHPPDLPSGIMNQLRERHFEVRAAAAGATVSAPPSFTFPSPGVIGAGVPETAASVAVVLSPSPGSMPPSFGASSPGGYPYAGSSTTPAGPPASSMFGDSETPVLPLAEVERIAIVRALEYTRGDRMMAASLLQIGRTTLYRKLKEYRLDGDPA